MIYEFAIKGRPITKKNSMQKTAHGLIQSKAYREYETAALWQLRGQTGPKEPIDCAVYMNAVYYMPDRRAWPDLLGLLQATADILQKARIIEDDQFIIHMGASKIAGIDKENPRVNVLVGEITNVRHPAHEIIPALHKKLLSGRYKRFTEIRKGPATWNYWKRPDD